MKNSKTNRGVGFDELSKVNKSARVKRGKRGLRFWGTRERTQFSAGFRDFGRSKAATGGEGRTLLEINFPRREGVRLIYDAFRPSWFRKGRKRSPSEG